MVFGKVRPALRIVVRSMYVQEEKKEDKKSIDGHLDEQR